jgi:hypothetical protein
MSPNLQSSGDFLESNHVVAADGNIAVSKVLERFRSTLLLSEAKGRAKGGSLFASRKQLKKWQERFTSG